MRVIFHADDFGLTRAINAGILEAHTRGLLRSASLIGSAGAAEDAAIGAAQHPGLDVGLHIALVEERPVLPPGRIPSLVSDGCLLRDFGTVCLRYALGRWRIGEALAEIEAQWDRLTELGIQPSHCDGHQHIHLLPRLFPWVVAQARQRGIRLVRARLEEPVGAGSSSARRMQLLAIRWVSAVASRRVPPSDRAAMIPFVTVGFGWAGGSMTTARLLEILTLLRERAEPIVEVMLHPGRSDAETLRKYGHWGYRWERDLELLLDPALPEALDRRGIEVTSFRDVASSLADKPSAGGGAPGKERQRDSSK